MPYIKSSIIFILLSSETIQNFLSLRCVEKKRLCETICIVLCNLYFLHLFRRIINEFVTSCFEKCNHRKMSNIHNYQKNHDVENRFFHET